jgi:hypothetical protein
LTEKVLAACGCGLDEKSSPISPIATGGVHKYAQYVEAPAPRRRYTRVDARAGAQPGIACIVAYRFSLRATEGTTMRLTRRPARLPLAACR